ncbi:preprotein translocase subunit SecG [Clostridium hydrogeniformans]|uniref:preprotein translocase subunit SecG n=1 Tax=Clostridium hydrogeniformans TaxID=349933 RepID=UPI00048018AC|nr:preprotein translocase subunit SecG [Clostridium hydrogeniformans]
MHNILVILEFILSTLLVIVVLLQPSKADGLKGFVTGTTETFFSKNKSRTREALLSKATVVVAVLFAANTIALNVIK